MPNESFYGVSPIYNKLTKYKMSLYFSTENNETINHIKIHITIVTNDIIQTPLSMTMTSKQFS